MYYLTVTLSDPFVAMKEAPQIHLVGPHDFGGSHIVQLATEQVQHWNYKFTLQK